MMMLSLLGIHIQVIGVVHKAIINFYLGLPPSADVHPVTVDT